VFSVHFTSNDVRPILADATPVSGAPGKVTANASINRFLKDRAGRLGVVFAHLEEQFIVK
jgi:transposase InsO family protein